MTQGEKKLLLKDLCARLPYLVKGLYQWKGNVPFDRELDGRLYDELYLSLYSTEDSSFKPYLRPMLSMTEEEKEELQSLCDGIEIDDEGNHFHYTTIYSDVESFQNVDFDAIDWLNSHHFDYRGLIEKGLALEAPNDMYKTE